MLGRSQALASNLDLEEGYYELYIILWSEFTRTTDLHSGNVASERAIHSDLLAPDALHFVSNSLLATGWSCPSGRSQVSLPAGGLECRSTSGSDLREWARIRAAHASLGARSSNTDSPPNCVARVGTVR